jgi:hypothetical protein
VAVLNAGSVAFFGDTASYAAHSQELIA